MGILSRWADIMKANINELLEKAEAKNADKLLEQYLREARSDLEEVKAETAAVIADEMAAGRRVTALDEEIVKLSAYAEQAVLAGNDADAIKFIEAKQKAAEQKASAEKAFEAAKKNSDRMRELTIKLKGDIESATAKLNELKAKLVEAQQTEKMNELKYRFDNAGASLSDYGRLSDAVQRRIDAANAKVELNEELRAEENSLEALKDKYTVSNNAKAADATAAAELAALKAKLGK